MTTELEKQFFDTFEIEPKLNDCNWQCQKPSRLIYMCANNNDCEHCKEYPQITDKQYLELIVLLSGVCCMNFAFERSLGEMKYKILKITMEYKKILKHQVQAIFRKEE